MLVKEVMSVDVITVTPDETLSQLVAKLLKSNCHLLPVVDEERRVVGVINFKDIMKLFISHNPALERLLKSSHDYRFEEEDILDMDLDPEMGNIKVGDLMNKNVVSVDESMTIAEVRNSMKMHNLVRMPVISGDKLAGFVTLFDIIVALFRKKGLIE